jgi:hypothetical protein
VQATFAECVVGGGEPTRGGAGDRCVALASLTRSNCRKAFSLPFFLSFNLQIEDYSRKQFFFSAAVLGVAFSSLRREHLRNPLRSPFFFLQIGFRRNMWSGGQRLYSEDDGKEPLACSTPIEQQLPGQLFELSDQPQNGTKRVPG